MRQDIRKKATSKLHILDPWSETPDNKVRRLKEERHILTCFNDAFLRCFRTIIDSTQSLLGHLSDVSCKAKG